MSNLDYAYSIYNGTNKDIITMIKFISEVELLDGGFINLSQEEKKEIVKGAYSLWEYQEMSIFEACESVFDSYLSEHEEILN